ncbi:MAG: EamA family transporter RarD [Robiginitomaculum sp.]|nr:EamA family transporter RarD [Robiginitomaculum sp.]
MNSGSKIGFLATFAAFFVWGVSPIYFKYLPPVTALEISFHRAIWACLIVGLLLLLTKKFSEVKAIMARPKVLGILAITSVMVAFNWFAFAWAAMNEHIAQASLGYFINPLVNVLLGFAFLQERLNRWRWFAVGLAALGVANQIIIVGSVPWLALSLAFTFGVYGILRKVVQAEAGPGLFVETLMLSPFLLVGVFWLQSTGQGHFVGTGLISPALLIFSGLLTAVPLFLFSFGARRLDLSTVGLIQYLAPSLQFGFAIFYGEEFTLQSITTFVLIWLALAIYSWDLIRKRKVY